MGTKERKEREREQRRELILNAAVELIAKNGFDKTTMEDIAQKAEFSKGTLYLYFSDKSALFAEIKITALELIQSKFSSILRQDATGVDLVMEMLNSFIDFLEEKSVYAQSLMLPEIPNPDNCSIQKVGREIVTVLTHALQIGLQDGSIIRKINPRTTAVQITLHMFGITQFFFSDSELLFSNILKENNTSIKQMIHQTIKSLLLDKEMNLTIKTNE